MFKLICFFVLALAAMSFIIQDNECPQDVEFKCVGDINKAYPICKKAAEAKGKDIDADLECMQYSYHVEKDCWPCICVVAHEAQWKIKGCK